MEGKSRVEAWTCLESQPTMPWERIHCSTGHGMELLQLGWFNFKARLKTLTQVAIPEISFTGFPFSQFSLPRGWVAAVDGWHIVTKQSWINCTQRDIEGVIPVARRHDMRPGILAEGAKGWRVRTQIWWDSRYSAALLKRWAMRNRAKRWTIYWSALLGNFLQKK